MNPTLLKLRLTDRLRYSSTLRRSRATTHSLGGKLAFDPRKRTRHRIRAYALSLGGTPIPEACDIEAWGAAPLESIPALGKHLRLARTAPALTRTIVLKEPCSREKGVLMLSFEYNWVRLMSGVGDLTELEEQFELIFLSSWSPTSFEALAALLARTRNPIWIQPSHLGDQAMIEAFHPRLKCLPLLASSWVRPDLYQPKPFPERRYDLLMVANWAPFKRHWEFFDALSRLPADLRVLLIGQKETGFTQEHIRTLASRLEVPQRLEIRESLPIEEVRAAQCDSRVALLLSRREGSCVALAEALFAGTAIGMRADARVGSIAFVNNQTGHAFDPGRPLAPQISELLSAAESMTPRSWAESHIACHRSQHILNETLRSHAMQKGDSWSRDPVSMCWNPHLSYLNDADRERLRPTYERLHVSHPKVFPSDLADISHR